MGGVNIKAQIAENPEEVAEARTFMDTAVAKIKAFPKAISDEFNRGMTEATGGYYTSKVEENEDPRNELGVHIENLQAADKEFFENEQSSCMGRP